MIWKPFCAHIFDEIRWRSPESSFSDDPKRCIRRTITDYRGCRSSPSVCRFGRCGNRHGIVCRLWRCQRFAPAVRSCLGRCRYRCSWLCRCTPEVIAFHPRRSGCVSVRYSSRQVCLGALWKVFGRTGSRRWSRSRYCRRAFWFRRGRAGFLNRIGNTGFYCRSAGGRSGCQVHLAPNFSSKSKLACGPMLPDL